MENHKATIDLLTSRIVSKEEEVNKLKKLVNELCHEIGMPQPYANVSDSAQGVGQIRSDHFYGHQVTTAIRNYLEMRRASNLGAATVTDIYSALKKGGLKFDTKDEENAKNTVRISLRKSSSIFHRLPNGEYGLLSWYPNAKPAKDDDDEDAAAGKAKGAKAKPAKPAKDTGGKEAESDGQFLTNDQVRAVVFEMPGNFKVTELESALAAKFPNQKPRETALPTLMYQLTKKNLIKVVTPRKGNIGATYCKA